MTTGGLIGAVVGGVMGVFVAWLLRASLDSALDRIVAGALSKSPDFALKEAQFRKQYRWATWTVIILLNAYFGWRSFG